MSNPYTDEYGYPLTARQALAALQNKAPAIDAPEQYKYDDEFNNPPPAAIIPEDGE